MINFKKKLTSIFTVENAPFLIVILFYIININYIRYGGIFYDDWSLATGYLETDLLERIKINCLLFFNTRPVGGLYIALITSVGKNDFFYILLNSSLWVLSGLILHKAISKIYTYQTNHSTKPPNKPKNRANSTEANNPICWCSFCLGPTSWMIPCQR